MALPPNVVGQRLFTANDFASLMGKRNDGDLVITCNGQSNVSLERVNRGNVFTRFKWKQLDVSSEFNGFRNQETRSALYRALCSHYRCDEEDVSNPQVIALLKDLGLDNKETARKPLSCRTVKDILDKAKVDMKCPEKNPLNAVDYKKTDADQLAPDPRRPLVGHDTPRPESFACRLKNTVLSAPLAIEAIRQKAINVRLMVDAMLHDLGNLRFPAHEGKSYAETNPGFMNEVKSRYHTQFNVAFENVEDADRLQLSDEERLDVQNQFLSAANEYLKLVGTHCARQFEELKSQG